MIRDRDDEPKSFYERRAWRDLRYRVLRRYGWKCMACGVSREDGAQIHVDHIRPISIYPEMALDEENLQVLCRDCNLGKSATFIDDFRPRQVVERVRAIAASPPARREIKIARIRDSARKHLAVATKANDQRRVARCLTRVLKIERLIRGLNARGEVRA